MNFLAGLMKGLNVVQGVLPFVNSTVTSVESLLGALRARSRRRQPCKLSVAGSVWRRLRPARPSKRFQLALNAVSPLIDSVVALKNVFGEFSKSNSATVQPTTPAVAASAPAQALAQS